MSAQLRAVNRQSCELAIDPEPHRLLLQNRDINHRTLPSGILSAIALFRQRAFSRGRTTRIALGFRVETLGKQDLAIL
jgi:hypothetical protein